ncbi:hypothetical protein [Bacterioplanoides sp.]|uniref:hypothetical protein n=1 Tax=Bacterioplanoides sp. TaxID=2066072 RepID=UPI003B5A5868
MALALALSARDCDGVEAALSPAPLNDPEYIKLLIDLLPLEWHKSHENIVSHLQALKPAAAVSVLSSVAVTKYPYLEYDNSLALARKCTWALADIGTDDAKEALVRISRCGEVEIEVYAVKRLKNWKKELARKGWKTECLLARLVKLFGNGKTYIE